MKKQNRPLIIRWILHSIAIIVASILTTAIGFQFKVSIDSFGQVLAFLAGVALLALANATIGKLLKLLVIPLNCLTLGLFSFVINAVVLIIVAQLKIGFSIEEKGTLGTFFAALIASFLITVIYNILNMVIPSGKDD